MTTKTFKMKATQAKNRFGELLDNAQAGPVMIEKNGRDVAVLLSKLEYNRLLKGDVLKAQQTGTEDSSLVRDPAPEIKQAAAPKPLNKTKTKTNIKNQKPASPEVAPKPSSESKKGPSNVKAKIKTKAEDKGEKIEPTNKQADQVDIHALVAVSLARHTKQWASVYQAFMGEQ
ncbi:MAG: type II toxin-antitoxin system prevent-host-death family antitoxin [Rhizobiaceae bacterium]